MLGLLVGAGLAATGASFQGLFRNPLADPYIIGASSGAALGASIGILSAGRAGLAALSYPSSYIPIFAFVGAVITVIFVYALSTVDGHMPTDTFLLAGVVVGSFVWAVVSFLMVTAGEDLPKVVMWLMGACQQRAGRVHNSPMCWPALPPDGAGARFQPGGLRRGIGAIHGAGCGEVQKAVIAWGR